MSEAAVRSRTARDAGPAIRGYAYQFDLTILEILRSRPGTEVFIEACEDIDLRSDDATASIQCKYLEAQSYSLAATRPAVLLMLQAFASGNKWDYRLYVHFGDGSVEPPWRLTLPELKDCLTEHKRKPTPHTILHYEGIADDILEEFLSRFTVTVGPSFEDQRMEVHGALAKALHGSAKDAEEVHYGNALSHIIDLSIRPSEESRSTTRSTFIGHINMRPALFSRWHREFLGEEAFLRSTQAMLKKSRALTAATRRCLVAPIREDGLAVEEAIHLAEYLAQNGFGTGHLTSATPWTLLLDATSDETAAVKSGLAKAGVQFNDGYEDYFFNTEIFDHPPVVNTKGRTSSVVEASYAVRLVAMQTYTKHMAELKSPKTLISFAELQSAEHVGEGIINLADLPSIGIDRMISFLEGAQ